MKIPQINFFFQNSALSFKKLNKQKSQRNTSNVQMNGLSSTKYARPHSLTTWK